MRKTLLATTAAASLFAFGAVAEQAADPAVPAAPAAAPEATMPEATTPVVPSDSAADTTMPADPATPATETAQEPMVPGAAPSDPAVADIGPVLTPVLAGDLSADNLIGAKIVTMNGEDIAQVEDVIVSPDGAVENIVAQFGGFLGFGSNSVLLTMDEIEVMQDESGTFVVQTALTPESLDGRPEYQAN